jgi:hypothetical protein
MDLTGMTVGNWRRRYRDLGLEVFHDELRPGRPRNDEDEKVVEVIKRALQSMPTDGTRSGQLAPWRLLRPFQKYGAPLAADLLPAAPPSRIVIALQRSDLC